MSNLPAEVSAALEIIEGAAQRLEVSQGGDSQFAKLDQNSGLWTYGVDRTEISADSVWVVSLDSIGMGYIAWGGGNNPPIGREVRPITQGAVDRSALDSGLDWKEVVSVTARCVESEEFPEDVGVQITFEASTLGGKKAVHALLAAMKSFYAGNPGKGDNAPLLKLSSQSYENRRYGGTTVNPIFIIDRWAAPDEVMALLDGDEAAPAAAPEPEPTPEPEPAPARSAKKTATRRRRAAA